MIVAYAQRSSSTSSNVIVFIIQGSSPARTANRMRLPRAIPAVFSTHVQHHILNWTAGPIWCRLSLPWEHCRSIDRGHDIDQVKRKAQLYGRVLQVESSMGREIVNCVAVTHLTWIVVQRASDRFQARKKWSLSCGRPSIPTTYLDHTLL